MQKELIVAAFQKAREDLKSEGVIEPSTHQASIRISNYLGDDFGFSFGERRLKDYYKSALDNGSDDVVNIAQLNVVKGLCKYLGYESYEAFIRDNFEDGKDTKGKNNSQKETTELEVNPKENTFINRIRKSVGSHRKTLLAIVLILIIGSALLIYNFSQSTRWMVWEMDHYIEVDFDNEELTSGNLKLYKEDRIENFKKVNNPDCNFLYFNSDGSVNVWYGKNKNGVLELFTDIGLHPETGKSLKPISVHMIRKYLCDSY